MKIVHLNDFYSPYHVGGTETSLQLLLPALAARGHVVSMITARIGNVPAYELIQGVHVYRIGRFPAAWLTIRLASGTIPRSPNNLFREELSALLEKLQPDLLHYHNLWLLGPVLLQLKGYRKVVTFHDYWPICLRRIKVRVGGKVCPAPSPVGCRLCLMTAPINLRDLNIFRVESARYEIGNALAEFRFRSAASDFVSTEVGSYYHIPVNTIRYGVSIDNIKTSKLPRSDYVLFAGRPSKIKGIDLLFDAFTRSELRDRRLLVASNLSVPRRRNIEVIGWQKRDSLFELMQQATCVVVPSLWPEPFGLVALEAQSVGTPVIASRIGGLPEQIDDGRTGILVPPGDIEALSAAISRCYTDQELQRQAQWAGPELVNQRFSLEKAVLAWENIYAEIA